LEEIGHWSIHRDNLSPAKIYMETIISFISDILIVLIFALAVSITSLQFIVSSGIFQKEHI
jgi:hypothetical protein